MTHWFSSDISHKPADTFVAQVERNRAGAMPPRIDAGKIYDLVTAARDAIIIEQVGGQELAPYWERLGEARRDYLKSEVDHYNDHVNVPQYHPKPVENPYEANAQKQELRSRIIDIYKEALIKKEIAKVQSGRRVRREDDLQDTLNSISLGEAIDLYKDILLKKAAANPQNKKYNDPETTFQQTLSSVAEKAVKLANGDASALSDAILESKNKNNQYSHTR